MPGARCTRGLVCKVRKEKAHTSIQVSGEHTDIPCAMVLRRTSYSPRWSGLVVTVAGRIAPADFCQLTRRQDHTTWPYASTFSSGVTKVHA